MQITISKADHALLLKMAAIKWAALTVRSCGRSTFTNCPHRTANPTLKNEYYQRVDRDRAKWKRILTALGVADFPEPNPEAFIYESHRWAGKLGYSWERARMETKRLVGIVRRAAS